MSGSFWYYGTIELGSGGNILREECVDIVLYVFLSLMYASIFLRLLIGQILDVTLARVKLYVIHWKELW